MKPCQVLELDDQRTYTIVECNGQAQCTSDLCSTCKDTALDPYSACREYKARGEGGIRHAHQQAIAANTGECAYKDKLVARHSKQELCWRWDMAVEVAHNEFCPEHTNWIKKCGTNSGGVSDINEGGLYRCSGKDELGTAMKTAPIRISKYSDVVDKNCVSFQALAC